MKDITSFFIGVGIAIIFSIILFVIPLENHSFISIELSGSGDQMKINNIEIINMKKPLINLFSPNNPSGIYNLDISIKDSDDKIILSATVNKLGQGESTFMINDNFHLKNELNINSILSLEGEKIDEKSFNQEIK